MQDPNPDRGRVLPWEAGRFVFFPITDWMQYVYVIMEALGYSRRELDLASHWKSIIVIDGVLTRKRHPARYLSQS